MMDQLMDTTKGVFHTRSIYYILWGFLIVERIFVLTHFNFEYTDDDQTIMCLAAQEFAQGKFHEPCFTGQAYNTHFESLLAVPLVLLNISPYKAVPIVTNILAILPFLLISFLFVKNRNYFLASLVLLYLITLPLEYTLTTSMPRGFITGNAIATLGLYILYSKNIRTFHLIGAAFLTCFSLILTPSAIILIVPVGLYWILNQNITLKLAWPLLFGGFIALLVIVSMKYHYHIYPERVLHKSLELKMGVSYFIAAINNFSHHFRNLFPFLSYAGFLSLVVLLGLSIYSFKSKNYKAGVSLITLLIFTFATLSINKIHDGASNIFYPYERMYYAIPIVIVFFIFILFKSKQTRIKYLGIYVLLIVVFSFTLKYLNFDKRIKVIVSNYTLVAPQKIDELKLLSKNIVNVSKKHDAQLIIIDNNYPRITYGLPIVSENKIQTITSFYDRRYWRLMEEGLKSDKNVLLHLSRHPQVTTEKLNNIGFEVEKITGVEYLYLLKNNTLKNVEIVDLINPNHRNR